MGKAHRKVSKPIGTRSEGSATSRKSDRRKITLLATSVTTTMSSESEQVLEIPSPADFHVHLRQGTLSALVTPHVRKGGFRLAYVMVCTLPGLTPSLSITYILRGTAEFKASRYHDRAGFGLQERARSFGPACGISHDPLSLPGAHTGGN